MARIHDLIRQVAEQSPDLARELAREVDVLSERRAFGLNFERHTPEEVELPGRLVRRGDKVHLLPPRGETPKAANSVMWVVESIYGHSGTARISRIDPQGTVETQDVAVDDLVVVAEFRDPIYPGLVSTGAVERGGDKPFHSVINGENFHVLQTLLFTHRGKVDAIYIDPPYNTGDRDWKYNNDYVASDDQYRHSKWLAFMERRLLLAKELLNPDDSTLIVTIDEKEYLRLGLLLAQVIPEARIQMVTAVTNPRAGVARPGAFTRTEEYLFYATLGQGNGVVAAPLSSDDQPTKNVAPIWFSLMRTGSNSARKDRPNLFYPVWMRSDGRVHSVGDALPLDRSRSSVPPPEPDLLPTWPIRPNGDENTWQLGVSALRTALAEGTARVNPSGTRHTINYLRTAEKKRIAAGEIEMLGRDERGALILRHREGAVRVTAPRSVWAAPAHDAGLYGSSLLGSVIPGRTFPFPKSLYSTEDALRFVLREKPMGIVVDFFAGSGTTAHAVMRLNRQDGGRRHSISVTNNEVSANEQKELREQGLRPGDQGWECWGICEYVTKPRVRAAITGRTPDGEPIKGGYKFSDVFPMADGFVENVEFFTLTYEAPLRVASHRDFSKVASLLWLRAGSIGRRIEVLDAGWDVADRYGVLADLDKSDEFVTAVAEAPAVRVAFVITDEDRLFEAVVQRLPGHVEPVRMYDAYLRNFELESRVSQ